MSTDWPCLVDGRELAHVPLDDRGLAYGDGVFETILIHRGEPVWWTEHLGRLRRGAERLGLPVPEEGDWATDLAHLLSRADVSADAVVKVVLTRGSGGRGYAPDPVAQPRRWISLHPAPRMPAVWRDDGIALHACETRLAVQPALAGIKHLNRLEQVLARAEWRDAEQAEGVVRDMEGWVISATAANLFARLDGQWLTPPVDRCGIAGICRAWLLTQDIAIERALSWSMLMQAEEVFVCSSVRGILPVVRLGERHWPVGPGTRECVQRLAMAQPAFAFDD